MDRTCPCCQTSMEPHPDLGAFVTHPCLKSGEPPVDITVHSPGLVAHRIKVLPHRCPACGLILMFETPAALKETHES